MPFQVSECYSPTSSQARVLVVQASVAVYLQDFPSRFFSYDSLNARKWRRSYQQATYKGNFSSVLNQEFPIFWFTSSSVYKQPVLLKYWLLRPFSTRKPCARVVPEMDYYTQRKQYHQRTTLCTWPWQSQERDAEWLAPTIARLIHGASVLLGT